MFRSMRGKTKLCNYICAALALILVLMQLFAPFWSYQKDGKVETCTINEFAWLEPTETALVNQFALETFGGVTRDEKIPAVVFIVALTAAILLLCVFSLIFCIKKARNGMVAIVPALAGFVGVLEFCINPAFRLGSMWYVQLAVAAVLLIAAAVTIVIGSKANAQEKSGNTSSVDIEAKVSAIKHMSIDIKELKGDITLQEVNFNRLVAFLKDSSEECRLAAVEMLSTSSKEVAFSHIVYLIETEESAKVKEAMKNALASIKNNMREAQ